MEAQQPLSQTPTYPTSTSPPPASRRKLHRQPPLLLLGPSSPIGAGDSSIHYAPPSDPLYTPTLFTHCKSEISWQTMRHRTGPVPRLVAVQGRISPSDGSIPVYRHPTDEYLPLLAFSPTVLRIKERVEDLVGHEMNHVLAQLYRSGEDHISEHSDKTLDIVRGSRIVNVSLGAQRTMKLRSKKAQRGEGMVEDAAEVPAKRETQLVPLPPNSTFILGPLTNTQYLHSIPPSKLPPTLKPPAELLENGERISLTFRHIGTFLSASRKKIWGQGARGKEWSQAGNVVNGDKVETERLVSMFGVENQRAEFDWGECYGEGSDLLWFWQEGVEEGGKGSEVVEMEEDGADV